MGGTGGRSSVMSFEDPPESTSKLKLKRRKRKGRFTPLLSDSLLNRRVGLKFNHEFVKGNKSWSKCLKCKTAEFLGCDH